MESANEGRKEGKKNSGKAEAPVADDELDALLDSALEDFGKPVQKIQNAVGSGAAKQSQAAVTSREAGVGVAIEASPTGLGATLAGEGCLGPELEELERAMMSMLEDGPLKEHMQRFADAAVAASSEGSGGGSGEDDPLSATIADALRGIAQSTQSLSENPTEEELARVLQSLCLSGGVGGGAEGGGDGTLPDLIPLVQNVMQSLLSKDLLYPALKDIVDKYPDWLAEKRPTIEEKQFETYNRQFELMKQVCDEYNAESTSDSEETKRSRFDRISKLMQSIQECGNPPKDLIGDVNADFDVDLFKNKLGEKECSIM